MEKSDNSQLDIELQEGSIRHKAIIRKIDWRLIPFCGIIYLFSYLDRVNIGFARLYHLEADLALSQAQYSWTLSIFFIGYVLFEVPSNLMLKKFTPPIWIARIMVTWGALTMCLAACNSFGALMATRFFLGVAEAGLFPGIIFYLSFWYTRAEQGFRMGLFYAGASASGAFSGLLAYGISHLDQHAGLKAWQWIFLLEGLPSVLLGFATWKLLPSTPDQVEWLTSEERNYVVDRLNQDHTDPTTRKFYKSQLIEAFTDIKVYLYMFSFLGIVCPIYSMAQLLPTIIKQFQFSNTTTLLMSAPPYVVSMFTIVLLSWYSDKIKNRSVVVGGSCIVAAIGFLVLALITNITGKYIAIILAVVGITTSLPPMLAWLNNNMVGATKSGTASAMVISFGNIGGVISSQFYRNEEAPYYIVSHSINLGFLVMSIICTLILRWIMTKENKKLEIQQGDPKFVMPEREDGIDLTNFRYTL